MQWIGEEGKPHAQTISDASSSTLGDQESRIAPSRHCVTAPPSQTMMPLNQPPNNPISRTKSSAEVLWKKKKKTLFKRQFMKIIKTTLTIWKQNFTRSNLNAILGKNDCFVRWKLENNVKTHCHTEVDKKKITIKRFKRKYWNLWENGTGHGN